MDEAGEEAAHQQDEALAIWTGVEAWIITRVFYCHQKIPTEFRMKCRSDLEASRPQNYMGSLQAASSQKVLQLPVLKGRPTTTTLFKNLPSIDTANFASTTIQTIPTTGKLR